VREEAFRTFLSTGEVRDVELKVRRKDGSILDVSLSASAIRDEDGNVVRSRSIWRDITERKRVERALQESEEWHRELVRTANDIVVSYDKEGKITYTSGKARELLGYETENVLGRGVVDFLPPEDADRSRALIKEVLGGMGHVNYEQGVLAKDGRLVLMDFNAAPLRDGNGKVIGAVVTGRDIRERRLMEEEAARHRQELTQADKLASLGTVVSGVAHELNNPSHFILLNAPILRDAWRDVLPLLESHARQDPEFRLANIPYTRMREEIPELIDDIIEGADRIKHITSELRDYAREQSSRITQPVEVNDVVRSALTLLAVPIRKSTSRFSVEYGDDLPKIRANHRRLEQVIINLILNACQALPDNDKAVRVTTRRDSKRGQVIVSVQDEGCGISEDNLARIQSPFYTTKREEGGTGLGLAVAARIVGEHEGRVEFESKIGEGTTARVLLPVFAEDRP
jgi:PAS domain S-box-containing protein